MDPLGLVAVLGALIGLPWLILHYITKWKTAPKITEEDEKMLDEMFVLARRLEDRLNTVERIVAADNPDYRSALNAPAPDFRGSLSSQNANYKIDRRN